MSDFDAARRPVRGALTDALARIRELEETLAANLFMQHGSAEAGVEILGGWNEAVRLAENFVDRLSVSGRTNEGRKTNSQPDDDF